MNNTGAFVSLLARFLWFYTLPGKLKHKTQENPSTIVYKYNSFHQETKFNKTQFVLFNAPPTVVVYIRLLSKTTVV